MAQQLMLHQYYIGIRILADRIGLDPWDVNAQQVSRYLRVHEKPATSRYWFGSPCRYLRTIDAVVHVWLPAATEERHPRLAAYLRRTSPRWKPLRISLRTHHKNDRTETHPTQTLAQDHSYKATDHRKDQSAYRPRQQRSLSTRQLR